MTFPYSVSRARSTGLPVIEGSKKVGCSDSFLEGGAVP